MKTTLLLIAAIAIVTAVPDQCQTDFEAVFDDFVKVINDVQAQNFPQALIDG